MPSEASSSSSNGRTIKTIARNAQRVVDITANRRQQSRRGLAKELLSIFEDHRQDLAELPYANKLLSSFETTAKRSWHSRFRPSRAELMRWYSLSRRAAGLEQQDHFDELLRDFRAFAIIALVRQHYTQPRQPLGQRDVKTEYRQANAALEHLTSLAGN
jgi:hypothetical protein